MPTVIIWTCVLAGIAGAAFFISFKKTGGAISSQKVRDRMTDYGSEIQKKRLQDMGLEPEDK